jgi:lipopolysaccharide transport system ATP-binding protein
VALIEVNHVVKEFKLGELTNVRLGLQRAWRRVSGRGALPREPFYALNDVHFQVQKGEVLGIIGTNGAGKSTLLKLLSRITTPTSGSIRVGGTIAPLIEVGAGLIGDLSGRENVYLNGAILGMPYREIRKKMDEIVAFAELEQFIDTPIKRYSSGMTVRLGFSIATAIDADILIVDEVLAVGDLAFQRKCFDRMEELIKRQGKTVLIVSHNTRQVERLCTRVLLLDHGSIVADDAPERVCELFYERTDTRIRQLAEAQHSASRWANTQTSDELEVTEVSLLDAVGRSASTLPYRQDMRVRVRFNVCKHLDSVVFTLGVHTSDFLYLTTHSSEGDFASGHIVPGQYETVCAIHCNPLLPGVYAIRLGVADGNGLRTLFYGENLVHFQVTSNPQFPLSIEDRHGFFELDAQWAMPRQQVMPAQTSDIA